MTKPDLTDLSVQDLLELHGELLEELKRRRVCRSSNNPVADYTEWLVASALSLKLSGNSQSGYDAVDTAGNRFQIKGRRLASPSDPPQLSVIRDLEKNKFDYLVAVIFDARFRVNYAAQVPHAVVQRRAVFNTHQRGHILHLKRIILEDEGVKDLTTSFRAHALRPSNLT
jgi:hypothetical protein